LLLRHRVRGVLARERSYRGLVESERHQPWWVRWPVTRRERPKPPTSLRAGRGLFLCLTGYLDIELVGGSAASLNQPPSCWLDVLPVPDEDPPAERRYVHVPLLGELTYGVNTYLIRQHTWILVLISADTYRFQTVYGPGRNQAGTPGL